MASKDGEGAQEPISFHDIVHGDQVTTHAYGRSFGVGPVAGGQQKIVVSSGGIVNRTCKDADGLNGRDAQTTANHDPENIFHKCFGIGSGATASERSRATL